MNVAEIDRLVEKRIRKKRGLQMKFSNKRADEAWHIYARGKGSDVSLILKYVDDSTYHPDSSTHALTIQEAQDFIKHFAIALEDAERRKTIIESEDE